MKTHGALFVFLSILIQLISIPILFGTLGFIASIFHKPHYSCSSDGLDFYLLTIPVVNYAIFFSIIIVTSVQETTKSELLASVMNVVWILFIWSETSGALRNRPYEYILFMVCISLTIPVRILFRKLFHS